MPPTVSELIFSEQAGHNFSKTLGEIKRSTLSISNRLESIQHDAVFAQQVSEAYSRPLIANERCGSWYIDPRMKGGSAYFKSTDGHTGVWKFSSRRLNLHILEIVEKHDGCIIVDSTRRGKRMPDALSKTIPIWCAVVNRYLFPDDPQFHDLYTPRQVISESEHAQISTLLSSFTKALQDLNLPVLELKKNIKKPLRPIWVTPESQLEPTTTIFEDYHPIICCTVSRRVIGGEVSEGGYIQGAGDDTENWAHGLTPPIFWQNKEELLSTPESKLPEFIEMLVRRVADSGSTDQELRCVKPTSYVFITPTPAIDAKDTGADTCTVVLLPTVTPQDTWKTSNTRLDVGIGPEKLGSKNLRIALPLIEEFVGCILYPEKIGSEEQKNDKHVILACQTGRDFSIGVALAIICLYFDDGGELLKEPRDKTTINKTFIRSRLGWFSTSMPDANPSRATLQSINSFLMDRRE